MGHRSQLPRTGPFAAWHVVLAAALVLCCAGCTRSKYRQRADAESYSLINSRQTDPRWTLPNRRVEPSHDSRMYVASEDDCGPKPPDDVAAHQYMIRPDGKQVCYYGKIPTRSGEDNPAWIDLVPRTGRWRDQVVATVGD